MWLLLVVAIAHAASFAEGQWLTGEPAVPWFGFSVALAEDVLVVGNSPQSPGEPLAFVFERRQGAWVQVETLTSEIRTAPPCQVQVHVSQTLLALLIHGDTDPVRVFARAPEGWSRLPLPVDQVSDVDLHQDQLAVATHHGAAVYTREGAELRPSGRIDLDTDTWSAVIHDIELDGDRLLIGVPHMRAVTPERPGGHLLAFRRTSDGWARDGVWAAPPSASSAGYGVAWAGEQAVGTFPFAIIDGVREGGLAVWEPAEWTPTTWHVGSADGLGGPVMASTADSLAASQGLIVTGLHFDRSTPMYGGVSLVTRTGDGWRVADVHREQAHPHFGLSVAVDGATVAVGAPRMDRSRPGTVWLTEIRRVERDRGPRDRTDPR